jgi:hypothetical protein
MSRRLWTTTILLVAVLAVIIIAAFFAMAENIITLSLTVLVAAALAVVAFDYLVLKPALLENAKRSAQTLCDAGEIIDPGLHQRLCNRLDTAPNDTKAMELRKKLDELKDKSDKAKTG